MKRSILFFMVSAFVVFFSATSFAQYLTNADVFYDAVSYPDFMYERGGAEGHSGAYIHVLASVVNYSDLKSINIKAKHLETDFEVTLKEASPECVGVWPFADVEQYFDIRLKPSDWMTGEWEFTLKFTTFAGERGRETMQVMVPRIYSPPEPTGVNIIERPDGIKLLAWNRIGDPALDDSRHVEYRVVLLDQNSCITEFYWIRPTGSNITYSLIPGNLIAVQIPAHWNPGDLVRIENRVYGSPGGVTTFGRATRLMYLPMSLFGSP